MYVKTVPHHLWLLIVLTFTYSKEYLSAAKQMPKIGEENCRLQVYIILGKSVIISTTKPYCCHVTCIIHVFSRLRAKGGTAPFTQSLNLVPYF